MRLGGPARRFVLLFATATACFSSGNDEGDEGGPYGEGLCDALVQKVNSCGVSTGSGPAACGGTTLSLCGVECMVNATCSELEELSCLGTVSDEILNCFGACGQASLNCAEGGGVYAPQDRCNAIDDCSDGSDEANCALFQCDDGGTVPVVQRCDLSAQCVDGSDEAGCNQLVSTCGGGGSGGADGSLGAGGESGSSALEPTYVASPTESCDRIVQKLADCNAGDDYYFYCYDDAYTYGQCVADCFEAASCPDALALACDITACETECAGVTASFVCDDSVELPEYFLCDGSANCLDESDEAGCPELPEYECPDDPGTFYLESDRCDEFNSCGTLPSADEVGCACLP